MRALRPVSPRRFSSRPRCGRVRRSLQRQRRLPWPALHPSSVWRTAQSFGATTRVSRRISPSPDEPAIGSTGRSRAKLRSLGLAVEADPGPEGDVRRLFTINHGPRLIWLRTIRKRSKPPTAAAVSRALGRRLSWLVPAYRLPNVKGLDALFCARPDVLLLQAMPGTEAAADAFADRLRLRRNFDRCRFPGGWRYPGDSRHGARQRLRSARPLSEHAERPERGCRRHSAAVAIPVDPGRPVLQRAVVSGPHRSAAPGTSRSANAGVVVAVVDSGCDLVHPDLVDAYVSPGRNAGDPTADGSPVIIAPAGIPSQHGTNVAGVIAAARNNRMGIAGLAGGCGLFSVAMPEHSTSEFADGITDAVESGAHVINLSTSIGQYWFSRARATIDEAVARGVVFCASSGNGSDPHLVFPAHYPPVMAIGGSDKTDGRWIRAELGLGSRVRRRAVRRCPDGRLPSSHRPWTSPRRTCPDRKATTRGRARKETICTACRRTTRSFG